VTASDLKNMRLEPVRLPAPDLLEGGRRVLLAGRQKIGKSWLALQIVNAIAEDTPFFDHEVARGEVVYLALENSFRRLHMRSELIGSLWSKKMSLVTEWSRGSDAVTDLGNILARAWRCPRTALQERKG
jgi:hypothetical protein